MRLNPSVFIGRNSLGSQLPAHPIGFLGKDHRQVVSQSRKCRGTTAHPSTNNRHVCGKLVFFGLVGYCFLSGVGSRGKIKKGGRGKCTASQRQLSNKASSIHKLSFGYGFIPPFD